MVLAALEPEITSPEWTIVFFEAVRMYPRGPSYAIEHSYGNCSFLDDLPFKHCDFPIFHSYVKHITRK